MKRWAIGGASGLLLLFALPAPSLGQMAAEAAQRWGLLGAWKPDCATPLSRSDGMQIFVVRGSALFLDRDHGDVKDSNPIPQAVINRDGTIDLTIVFEWAPQTRRNVMARRSDGRIRVITNWDVKTGDYSVRDGKLLHNGNAVPWVTRCR